MTAPRAAPTWARPGADRVAEGRCLPGHGSGPGLALWKRGARACPSMPYPNLLSRTQAAAVRRRAGCAQTQSICAILTTRGDPPIGLGPADCLQFCGVREVDRSKATFGLFSAS